MSNEDTTSKSDATIQDFIIREMRAGFNDVHRRIDRYNETAIKNHSETSSELRQHVISCDSRYKNIEQSLREKTVELPAKESWLDIIAKKLANSAIHYIILAVIGAIYFAITHGWKP